MCDKDLTWRLNTYQVSAASMAIMAIYMWLAIYVATMAKYGLWCL